MTFPIADVPDAWARHEHYVLRLLWRLSRRPGDEVLRTPRESSDGASLAREVCALAATLRRVGTGPGTTVAVLTEPNHPAMPAARWAAHLLGACVVHIRATNPRSDTVTLSTDTRLRVLAETGATVLVTDAGHAEQAAELVRRAPGPLRLVGVGTRAPGTATSGDDGLVRPGDLPAHDPARRAVVAFTSGSTGEPKGIVQSFATWNAIVNSFPGGTEPGERTGILVVTPLAHTVGSMVDAVLCDGGRAVLHEGFDPGEVLRAFGSGTITDAYLAVPHLYALIDHPALPDTDLSRLRRVVYSGTPASPRRIAEAHRVFGDCLIQLYGTTEAGGISGLTPLDHREPELLSSVGRPFPWVRVVIRDPDTGAEVPRGETGEVVVEAPTVMDGYLSDPAPTWPTGPDPEETGLRTGDLGHWDVYGYLHLDGRVGQVIKSGGLKIHPTAVEQALLTHPGVAQAVVYGVRAEDLTEYVHAIVVPRPGAAPTADELRSLVGTTLSPLHTPTEITFREVLPLTERGKPDRAGLRSRTGGKPDNGSSWKGTT
ncbi:class I adenylate-forming enzyme family protein [Streptomyces sp. ST2-7A]|uniref:class I adenylate-forming enzyme family protein n=1 Tax=Streptomyces sp. ST2-7A TaxID=2907214 RepID=UPI001F238A2E|nr:AMP-binding protein [Streptomyces sp. ST2-7A]MCE7080570.1 AMP-binding protein [Streptomyces sp. ST2-7A]